MLNLILNEDQLTDLVSNNPDLALEYFRDSLSTSGTNVTENSSFPKRLRFYMEKCGVNRTMMLIFFRNNYPSLLSSESGLGHILTGIRTPKLSVVLGMAECLEIAPAKLLPGVAGTYMIKQDDHVELYMDPDTNQSDESTEESEVLELPEVTETELEPVSEDIVEEDDLSEIVPQSATIAPEPVSDDTEEDDAVDPEIAGKEDSAIEELLEVAEHTEEEEEEDIVDPVAEDKAKKDSEEEELEYIDDLLDNIF